MVTGRSGMIVPRNTHGRGCGGGGVVVVVDVAVVVVIGHPTRIPACRAFSFGAKLPK